MRIATSAMTTPSISVNMPPGPVMVLIMMFCLSCASRHHGDASGEHAAVMQRRASGRHMDVDADRVGRVREPIGREQRGKAAVDARDDTWPLVDQRRQQLHHRRTEAQLAI